MVLEAAGKGRLGAWNARPLSIKKKVYAAKRKHRVTEKAKRKE